jgi:hypothetical protein
MNSRIVSPTASILCYYLSWPDSPKANLRVMRERASAEIDCLRVELLQLDEALAKQGGRSVAEAAPERHDGRDGTRQEHVRHLDVDAHRAAGRRARRAASRVRLRGAPPSEWACHRFAAKLREHKHLLDACIGSVLDRLREQNPGMGENIAIDGSDLPAYANGQRFLSKHGPERERYSDPDASWGHRSAVSTRRGGGF